METVELERPVMAEGNVEVWLNALLTESQRALHGVIRQAVFSIDDSAFQLIEFLTAFPAQVRRIYKYVFSGEKVRDIFTVWKDSRQKNKKEKERNSKYVRFI